MRFSPSCCLPTNRTDQSESFALSVKRILKRHMPNSIMTIFKSSESNWLTFISTFTTFVWKSMYLLHIKQLVLFKRFPPQIERRHLDLPNLYLNVKISVNMNWMLMLLVSQTILLEIQVCSNYLSVRSILGFLKGLFVEKERKQSWNIIMTLFYYVCIWH